MVYGIVGLFGMIGALLRYYLEISLNRVWHHPFPFATLLTNLIGCFILGWITTYLSHIKIMPSALITGAGTGLIGSFTTFSTFSTETVRLLLTSHPGTAVLYVSASLWGGILASYIGFRFGQLLFNKRKISKPDMTSIKRWNEE